MRIAVAHEWLTNWAGSERVAEELVRTASADELVVSVVVPDLARKHFPDITTRALWPSRLPTAQEHWARFALPMLAAWATTRIEADVLLVSSHFAAHGATVRFDGPSLVYYHTPARILWRPDMELDRLPPAVRATVDTLVLPGLRRWDRHVAQSPTVLMANSVAVASRVKQAYGRDAHVVHPPVEIDRWLSVGRQEPRHFVWLGRLVAYKKPVVAVEAARRSGALLLVIGDGPERAALERAAPPNVRFLGHAPDQVVRDALAHAHALIFPGEEDFGIAPVEALAAGVPIIAHAAGGALDYVVHGKNGLLIESQDPADFALAMTHAQRHDWDVDAIRDTARRFAPQNFRDRFAAILETTLGGRCTRS